MTTLAQAKRRPIDAPELGLYGYPPWLIARYLRGIQRDWSWDDEVFQRTVPGRLLPASKVHRGRFR